MPDHQKLRDQASVQLNGGWKLFAGLAGDKVDSNDSPSRTPSRVARG